MHSVRTELSPVYRRLLKSSGGVATDRPADWATGQLDKEMATLLSQDQAAVERLAEVPGRGVDSARQIITDPSQNPQADSG
jgi:hypothetical protein